jgi:VanZ family protein
MRLIPSTAVARRLAVAYAIVVVAISSCPGLKLPEVGSGILDKVAHFLQYAILGFLVARGWGPWRTGGPIGFAPWIPALILLAFAGADEYHQHWIPGRVPEWQDWAADIFGIAIGYALGAWGNRRIMRRAESANRQYGDPRALPYQF